jgi:hypothetical protein
MKNNSRLGALPVPFFMMIRFASVTFSQGFCGCEQPDLTSARSKVA